MKHKLLGAVVLIAVAACGQKQTTETAAEEAPLPVSGISLEHMDAGVRPGDLLVSTSVAGYLFKDLGVEGQLDAEDLVVVGDDFAPREKALGALYPDSFEVYRWRE